MKKIVVILMTTLISLLITSCATTSGVGTRNIDESELTNPSYLKKICQVQQVYGEEGAVVCWLDNRKGNYIALKDGYAACVLVRDGELYDRQTLVADQGVILTYNLHDTECKQITSMTADGKGYYYFEDEILKMYTNLFRTNLLALAEGFGLDKYIKK